MSTFQIFLLLSTSTIFTLTDKQVADGVYSRYLMIGCGDNTNVTMQNYTIYDCESQKVDKNWAELKKSITAIEKPSQEKNYAKIQVRKYADSKMIFDVKTINQKRTRFEAIFDKGSNIWRLVSQTDICQDLSDDDTFLEYEYVGCWEVYDDVIITDLQGTGENITRMAKQAGLA